MNRNKMKDAEAALMQVEQSTLGAAMMSKNARIQVAQHITRPSDFHFPKHMLIWEAICELAENEKPTGAVAVVKHLADAGTLTKVGGGPYVHDLLAIVDTTCSAGHFAETVAKEARRREFQNEAARIKELADANHDDLEVAVRRSRAALDGLSIGASEWPEPIPFVDLSNLPPFPTEMLPDWERQMVDSVAEATQTPADLAGGLALTALSTALQGKIWVEGMNSDWVEPCCLYVCVALDPGNLKSPVFDAMVRRPLTAVERELMEEAKQQIIEAKAEADVLARAAEAARIYASKNPGDPDAMSEAKRAAVEAESAKVPAVAKLFVDDTTPEMLKTLLFTYGAMGLNSDEGGLFQIIGGKYSSNGQPDMDVFLKGYNGSSIRVERKSSGAEAIDSPVLTIGLSPQPEVIRDAAGTHGFQGRGLLDRFLWALPKSKVGFRKHNPEAVPGHVKREYERRIAALTHAAYMTKERTTLKLTPAARQRLSELVQEREPKLRPGGEWESIRGWGMKWIGQVLRIAGLLHIAEHGFIGRYEPIEADTLDAAAYIALYYAEHALVVWGFMGADPVTQPASMLLEWLHANAKPGMDQRTIFRRVRGRSCLSTIEKVRVALDLLEKHGFIRRRPNPSGKAAGRPPSPKYDFHPQIKGTSGEVSQA
jgi:hypothetical protein